MKKIIILLLSVFMFVSCATQKYELVQEINGEYNISAIFDDGKMINVYGIQLFFFETFLWFIDGSGSRIEIIYSKGSDTYTYRELNGWFESGGVYHNKEMTKTFEFLKQTFDENGEGQFTFVSEDKVYKLEFSSGKFDVIYLTEVNKEK